MTDRDARVAAERAARESYGRLLSVITARTGDVSAAEAALAEAFARALETWPDTGPPDSPEAWLITVARRVAGHDADRARTRSGAMGAVEMMYEEMEAREMPEFPDERLKLLFACAHPAIDPAARTPLMLQCVLGMNAEEIARAFLATSAAMGQRLVRAKARLKSAGIPFRTPAPADLPDRLDDVLTAIYAAFGVGWDMIDGAAVDGGLTEEALYLGRLAATMLPDEPEPKGLLALMLYCEARRPARRDANGDYVPLNQQPRALWRADMLEEAEALLSLAAGAGQFGRFQTEAAIQSVHMQTKAGEAPNARGLAQLYDLLALHRPTVGALVGRALAIARLNGAAAGAAALEDMDPNHIAAYQPWWAARLHLAREMGAPGDTYREKAISLTTDTAAKRYLAQL